MFNEKLANIFFKSVFIFSLRKICLFLLPMMKSIYEFFNNYRNNFNIFKWNILISI